MNKITYQEAIKIISETDVWPRKAMFVVLITENMLPCYEFFYESESWGNPEILKEGVSLLYESVFVHPDKLKEDALICQQRLELVSPDLDDFAETASYGLDSCVAVDEALYFLITQSSSYLERVVNAVANTLDMFIQVKENMDSNDQNLQEKIDNDPFMINEINRQIALVLYIHENIGEQVTQSDFLNCKKVNSTFGAVIDFSLLPYS